MKSLDFRENLFSIIGKSFLMILPVTGMLLMIPGEADINYFLFISILSGIIIFDLLFLLLTKELPFVKRIYTFLFFVSAPLLILSLCLIMNASGGSDSFAFPLFLIVIPFVSVFFMRSDAALAVTLCSAGAYVATIQLTEGLSASNVQTVTGQVLALALFSYMVSKTGEAGRDEVRMRERAMSELRRLSESDIAASQFFSSVSYEMKTPLTSIQGYTEILINEKNLEEHLEREYVEIINEEAEKLTELTEILLDISRLESGRVQLEKEEVDIEHLLKGIVSERRMRMPDAKIGFIKAETYPRTFADKKRLRLSFEKVFDFIQNKALRVSEIRISVEELSGEAIITINYLESAAFKKKSSSPSLNIFEDYIFSDEEKMLEPIEVSLAKRIVMFHKGVLNSVEGEGGWSTIVIRVPSLEISNLLEN